MRVAVDRLCPCHAPFMELAPSPFLVDGEGCSTGIVGEMPPELGERAQRALRSCPEAVPVLR